MGVSKSPAELAVKLQRAGAAIAGENRGGVQAAAMAYKVALLEVARRDSGGDLRLSRWGRNGVKLNAGYDVQGSGPVVTAKVEPRPKGVWRVLEDGARPHVIAAGLTRRQGQMLTLFSVMAGQGGDLSGYDPGALASIARGNRNNRSSSRRRGGKKQALTIGSNLRTYARHPGTKGKGTFTEGFRNGTGRASSAYQAAQFRALGEVFR
jgi:hypothetical protein